MNSGDGGSSVAAEKPRVLHVLGSLELGGIENWLLHLLRNQSNSPVQHEFLLTKSAPGPNEPEFKALGIPIWRVPFSGNLFDWFLRARRFLRAEGPFAMVQSHACAHFTALAVVAAKVAGVPVRIAHSHEARHLGSDQQTVRLRLRRALAVLGIRWGATQRIGISDAAAEEIVGSKWRDDATTSILLYGFDFSGNDGAAERAVGLRRELDIRDETVVIGHVGRFAPVKNHDLLVRAFAQFAREEPNAVLVMIGTGELRADVEKVGRELGVVERMRFAGATQDVPAFMALFDLFVFPSFSEGLGIACLEAQAAGTPSLISEGVPREVIAVPEAVEVLPIEAGPMAWAAAMHKVLQLPRCRRDKWREQVENSVFGIRRCVADLNAIYAAALGSVEDSAIRRSSR
jgi:glycosyltransferase involved in cell wall biosynthesis